ncbi:GC-rich sequence DNA-binding factor 2 isoform X2 [Girardinichthys multiradiatus]|uniref:GC-rich sequence DNA-binding factor 2 isoform X2 n=1 Tax=Girardinichthys multiradiatus TaxID=208333 RepID=UPI001FADAACA|nr:GC-rich sequence DNA-binding factor 2 isoform X2 [Girardinichthys multiradiatus]
MFNKKPRRNFRQRKQSSSEDEDQQKNGGEGDEPEGAPSVINKPPKAAQNRGISCSSKREATPPRADSSDGEAGAETLEVTEDRVEGDKDGTKKTKSSVLSFTDDKEAEESTFKLKRSSDKAVVFQVRKKEAVPTKTNPSKASGGGDAPSSVSPRHDDSSEASPYSQHSDDDTNDDDDINSNNDDDNSDGSNAEYPASSSNSDSGCSATKPIIIPKAKEIDAARRRRRAARAQKEFISLGRDGRSSAGSTPDYYSKDDEEDRVEIDDDDEPDDHERRIEFAPRMKSIRERIAEKLGGSDGSLSGTDEEEQELWEQTQIEKGVKRRPGEQSPSGSESSSYSSSRPERGRHKKRQTGPKIPKTLPPISVSLVKKRITAKLDSLKEVYRARQAELRRMEGDAENAKSSLELLEESSSEGQLSFYRIMILYVHNLVECLQEKVVEINGLELEMHTLLSDQMEALLAQRRRRIKEEADHLQQLSYNTEEQTGSSAQGADTRCEMDSAINPEKYFNLPEDSEPSAEEEEQLQKGIADIQSRSQAVFADVQDDFYDIKKILSRFEEWRRSYSESYHNAYISLCLPKLLNPIIRHQLLMWNPLKDVGGEFENLPWFTAVETFCHGHGHEELEDTDRETLSNVIEKTLLPKMTSYVELVWDPLSHQQSACLSSVCHRLKEDYSILEGEQSKPVKGFIEAVVRRLRSCVDEDVFIPLYPKKLLEDKTSPQRRFRDKQFWTAVKLLGNMGKWDLLLPEPVLKELMLDKLLNRYLMITLSSQTMSSSDVLAHRKIAGFLPASWFEGESICLPQLQNFRNNIVQKVHSLCKQQPPEDPSTRSAVVEELKVLSRMRCYDSIMALTEKYHYEDAVYSHQLLNQETE